LSFVIFLTLLLSALLVVRVALRKLTDLLQWERLHWSIQGIGLALGGLRGLWSAGLVLLLMLSLGVPSLAESIQKRSILAPRLVKVAQETFDQAANWFPGHTQRVKLMPAIKLPLLKLPEANL